MTKDKNVSRKYKIWTEEENDFIRNNANLSDRELAEALNRTYYSVQAQRENLGIYRSSKRPWTVEDLEFLSEESFTNDELAETLGRSVGAVKSMRYMIKSDSKNSKAFHVFTEEDDKTILEKTLSLEEISQKLGISKRAIASRRIILNARSGERNAQKSASFTNEETYVLSDLRWSTKDCASLTGRPCKSILNKRQGLRNRGIIPETSI